MTDVTKHPSQPRILRIRDHAYMVPDDVFRLVISRLITLAERCGSEAMEKVKDETVEVRATEAIAFLARALRAGSEEALDVVIAEEVARYANNAQGGREVYANLCALETWVNLMFGKLSRLFLCQQHQEIAEAQDAFAQRYAEEDSEDENEGAAVVSDAIAEALREDMQRARHPGHH